MNTKKISFTKTVFKLRILFFLDLTWLKHSIGLNLVSTKMTTK